MIRSIGEKFGISNEKHLKCLKRSKQPNSLSCKHKIEKCNYFTTGCKQKRKRKRNRIKVTWAMKQAIDQVKRDLGIFDSI